jgi:1-aminocyclopropane-1-carboxylate deaminase/D-cysteine desulfhydrase-like pyridoxal-dependent ACC family enzyme
MRGLIRSVDDSTTIHGIAALSQAEYLRDRIQDEGKISVLHTQFSFGGFGKYDERQLRFNNEFTRETGVLLDPIYTGKMMRGLIELASDEIFENSDVLCIHTGGLTGLLSQKWLNSPF